MQFLFQKKLLIFSIIFFIFSCFAVVFLYRNIKSNEETTRLALEEWQKEATHRENARSLVNSVKAIESERKLLETHFVQSSDVVPFLDTIEKLARDVGAKAEVVSVDIAKDNPFLFVEMRAEGNFETLYKLITLLENSPYELEFTSVDIKNTDTTESKTPQWSAVLFIKLISFIK